MCYQNRLHATINQAGFRNMLHMVIDIDKTIVNVTQKCYAYYRQWQKKITIYIDIIIRSKIISK